MEPTFSTERSQVVLIHDVIEAVQESLDMADETANRKHQFEISSMSIEASFDFEMSGATDYSDTPSQDQPRRSSLFSLFHRDSRLSSKITDSESSKAKSVGKMSLKMNFIPGGRRFANAPSDANQVGTTSGSTNVVKDDI